MTIQPLLLVIGTGRSSTMTCYVYIKTTGQVGKVIERRPSGYRIANIGIVPFEECREATKQEVEDWWKSLE